MEQFNFVGFEPGEKLRIKAERILDRILERSPSDAKATAIMKRDGAVFQCRLEIGSSSCPFSLECSHKIPELALEKLQALAFHRLDRWCQARFFRAGREGIRYGWVD